MWFLVFPILSYLGSGFSSIWAAIDLESFRHYKRYEGFRQVHDIHKYFAEISVSVVCSVCPTCHHCIGFWRFCMRFSVLADFFCGFTVLNDFSFGFEVSNIPQCPPPFTAFGWFASLGTPEWWKRSPSTSVSWVRFKWVGWVSKRFFSVILRFSPLLKNQPLRAARSTCARLERFESRWTAHLFCLVPRYTTLIPRSLPLAQVETVCKKTYIWRVKCCCSLCFKGKVR